MKTVLIITGIIFAIYVLCLKVFFDVSEGTVL